MPKKYGVKEKDLVVNHIVDLVLGGELRASHARQQGPRGVAGRRVRIPSHHHRGFLPTYEAETAAIHRCDPDGARAANMQHAKMRAEVVIAELAKRGVLSDGPSGGAGL